MNTTIEHEGLTLKKLTLTAWAKILLDTSKIDLKKYNIMIEKIDRLTE